MGPTAPRSNAVREKRIAFVALACAVLAGIAGFLIGGAPKSYSLVNAAALLLAGFALLAVKSGQMRKGEEIAAILAAPALLVATLLFGPNVEGVHRWLSAGPITLHIGMLVIPSLCVVLANQRLPHLLSVIGAAMALVWAQPDTASALALCCATLFSCEAQGRKGNALLRAVALAGLVATGVRADPLQGVPFVETAIGDAWKAMPLIGALEAIALIAAIAIAPAVLARTASHRAAPAFALAGAMTGFTLAGLVAAYPQPLVGYGASAIVGYGLALALLCRVAEQ